MELNKQEDRPFFTVITVVYNNAKGIEETIKSVINQKDIDFEFVIIDGGSTDGTVEVIQQYSKFVSVFLSESDKGIADAFNKGICASNGLWINFMNSGDAFINENVLSQTQGIIESVKEEEFLLFSGYAVNQQRTYRYPLYVPNNRMHIIKKARQAHPSSFFNKKIFKKYGCYDLEPKIGMDYDLLLRVLKHENFYFIKKNISIVDTSGLSSNYIRTTIDDIKTEMRHVSGFGDYFHMVLAHVQDIVRRIFLRITFFKGKYD